MDEQRRGLEREGATGDEVARAHALRLRVRAGELAEDRLWLAARLGDPAAARLVSANVKPIESSFRTRFRDRVELATRIVLEDLDAPWSDATGTVLGALAAAKGRLKLASRIYQADTSVACPTCQVTHPSALRSSGPIGRAPRGDAGSAHAQPLPLDSARWGELRHAYGSAADVPGMLQQLGKETVAHWEGRSRGSHRAAPNAWDDLYGSVHHQGDVGVSTYAVIPHIVDLAERAAPRDRHWHLGFVASVFSNSSRQESPPPEFAKAYESAVGRARSLSLQLMLDVLRDDTLRFDLTAVAVLCGGIKIDPASQLDDGDRAEIQQYCSNDHEFFLRFDEQEQLVVTDEL